MSDGSTQLGETEMPSALESSLEELEAESYFGISLADSGVQTEFDDNQETGSTPLCCETLGFQFVALQALNNLSACHARVERILLEDLARFPVNQDDSILEMVAEEGVVSIGLDGFDLSAIERARKLIDNTHWVKCDTSYTSFSAGGQMHHEDDWSSSINLAAFVSIHDEAHWFFLECAQNAAVDMVCAHLHNHIVKHISQFLFSIEIGNAQESELINELDREAIELQIIPLVSHRGCLHPLGEPCDCCDTDSD